MLGGLKILDAEFSSAMKAEIVIDYKICVKICTNFNLDYYSPIAQ